MLENLTDLQIIKPKAEDTLGILRKDLPQIKRGDYEEFFEFLEDNGAYITHLNILPTRLTAIQGEFSDNGVIRQILKNKTNEKKPVIISKDNYIIDGHHRWLVALNLGMTELPAIRVDMGINDLLSLTLKFPKVTFKSITESSNVTPTKMITESAKNQHIEHIEDLILWHGMNGARRSLEILRSLETNPSQISIKWDGSPAMIFGRNEQGQFVLTDKSGFGATKYNGKVTSASALYQMMLNRGKPNDSSRQKFAINLARTWDSFESAIPSNFDGYVMGDLLFYSRPIKSNGNFVFTPNTVTYSVGMSSEIGRKISDSNVGIVLHKAISHEGFESDIDMSALSSTNKLFIMTPVTIKTPPKINEEMTSRLSKIIDVNEEIISDFLSVTNLKENKILDLTTLFYRFINARARERNFKNMPDGFLEWSKTYSSISTVKQTRMVQYIEQNIDAFRAMFSIIVGVMKIKNDVVRQLDRQSVDVSASINGATGGEGYVVGKGEVKLVNRAGFTAMNAKVNRIDK